MKNEIGYVDKIRKTGKKVMSLDCLKFARKQFSKKSGMRCYIDLYAALLRKLEGELKWIKLYMSDIMIF